MSDTKPNVLAVNFANIPQSLKRIDRWVLWRYVKRESKSGIKWDKVPFTIRGAYASSTKPEDWSTFREVEHTYQIDDFDGVGLVIHGPEFQGIDADDCLDEDGVLNDFGQELLDRIDGYAEISPSGTGLKIFAKTNLQSSNTKKELELYVDGRYFTVTGNRLHGHDDLSTEVQELDWLVAREFNQTNAVVGIETEDLAIMNLKAPLPEWTIDRVRDEVLAHLSPDGSYAEWLEIGMALHHQGQGDGEWLDLWDAWSQDGSTYSEGACEKKWDSFNRQRAKGKGPKTLRALLDKTQAARAQTVTNIVDDFIDQIENIVVATNLETVVARNIARNRDITDMDRERLAKAIADRSVALKQKIGITTVRGWLKAKVSSEFIHTNADGLPLCTIENLNILLRRMNTTVRYNVISKQVEILIASDWYTQDNQFNASLACINSEANKVGMPTKHINLFLLQIADKNQFNPVVTWVGSKPWDGISRIDRLAATIESPMSPEFKKVLLLKWLKQCIAAAYSPNGISPQGVMVFQGEQFKGKTRWFQSLVSPRPELALTGHTLDVKNKDSILIALSYWLVELGELDATFSRSEISALKSHITQSVDKVRRPYAPAESVFPRRTSYFASVNEMQFLHDPTGNRRFWVIPVTGINHDHGIDMQQVWAEVLELYQADDVFYLNNEELCTLNFNNQDYTAHDPIEERILGAFDWNSTDEWEWASATDVLIRCGIVNPTKSQTMSASRTIRKHNGNRHRKSNGRNLLAIPKSRSTFAEIVEKVQ